MKNTAYIAILALALSAGAAAQDKGKGKGGEKQGATVERPAAKGQPATPQAKGTKPPAKRAAAGTAGTSATQGSCSPDTTPPVIHSVSASPDVLWSPNHRMTPVSVSANVTDNCSGVTWSVTSVGSDEPVNGTGDGDTAPDWSITGGHAVNLRSERAGTGDGRVYTITITARDGAGNRTTGTTQVSVPHSQKN